MKYSLIIIIFLLYSCNYEAKKLDNITYLKKMEILAIKLSTPEAHPLEEVKAEMLIGYPSNYNSDIEIHKVWLLCDPENSGENEEGLNRCSSINSQNYLKLISFDIDEFKFKLPKSSLNEYDLHAKYIYIVGGICIDKKEKCQEELEKNNIPELLKSPKFQIAFKRLRLINQEHIISNKNPIFEYIELNDSRINDDDSFKYNNENKLKIKVKITQDSFDGSVGDKEFIPIYYRSNFGEFKKYKILQFYGEENIEVNELSINNIDKDSLNKRIYIISFNLRGGVNFKEIRVVPFQSP
jgi:hypothetical protein